MDLKTLIKNEPFFVLEVDDDVVELFLTEANKVGLKWPYADELRTGEIMSDDYCTKHVLIEDGVLSNIAELAFVELKTMNDLPQYIIKSNATKGYEISKNKLH